MILGRELERLLETGSAEFSKTLLGKIEMFEAPLRLFSVDRVHTEMRLRGADRLDRDDRLVDPRIVVDRAEALGVLEITQALVENVLLELLMDFEVAAGRKRRDRQIALGDGAGGTYVFFRARPDAANDVIDGK